MSNVENRSNVVPFDPFRATILSGWDSPWKIGERIIPELIINPATGHCAIVAYQTMKHWKFMFSWICLGMYTKRCIMGDEWGYNQVFQQHYDLFWGNQPSISGEIVVSWLLGLPDYTLCFFHRENCHWIRVENDDKPSDSLVFPCFFTPLDPLGLMKAKSRRTAESFTMQPWKRAYSTKFLARGQKRNCQGVKLQR